MKVFAYITLPDYDRVYLDLLLSNGKYNSLCLVTFMLFGSVWDFTFYINMNISARGSLSDERLAYM